MPPWINLANLFTLLRLLLVPVIVAAIIHGRHFQALAVFAIAAFTDILDGAAARRSGAVTRAGAYLDPIADKCLLSGVFLALAAAHIVPWWFIWIVLGRDLYILLGVGTLMLTTGVRKFPPTVWGKASTFVQIVTVVAWLTRNVLQFPVLEPISSAILWVCVGSTIWSGLHYTWIGFQIARAH